MGYSPPGSSVLGISQASMGCHFLLQKKKKKPAHIHRHEKTLAAQEQGRVIQGTGSVVRRHTLQCTVWSWVSHLAFLRVTMSFSFQWGPDPPHQSTTSPWPQYWTQGQTLPGNSAGKTPLLVMPWVPKILTIEFKPGTAGNHFCHHTERTCLRTESARRPQPRRTRQQCN